MSNKDKAINLMNNWGKQNIPFLFIIDFDLLSPQILRLDLINKNNILYNINGVTNCPESLLIDKKITLKKNPITYKQYAKMFSKLKKHISGGDTYLCNLTAETPIDINLTLKEIFLTSKAKYKLLIHDKVLVFSPETFIKIHNHIISSNPMKGTIDATIENAEQKLLNNHKEIAEHYTIVDLIRNDLSMVANKVRVEKFRYVEKINTNFKDLFQISSLIVGELQHYYASKIGDILFTLLPAGSISGAPKKKTIEIINNIEGYKRGYYTGIVGIFDGKNLDSGVMIRFIEKKDNNLVFKSGGGITTFSNAKIEYQELIDKVYVPIARNH